MPKQKKSQPARSRNGRGKRSASQTTARPAKRKRPARRAKMYAGAAGPTPLVKIVSVMPGNPVPLPGVLTVNAACRMLMGQACIAYLMDTAAMPVDVGPNGGPGPNPNTPQFTFNLGMPGKTYALEVAVIDGTGKVLVTDSQLVTT